MLVLMCHAGNARYAIDSADVIEVVPLVNFDAVADAPDWCAGVFAHRGAATPLADLTLLLTGQPCPRRWNSRLILVRCNAKDMPDKIGLLAERVTTAEIERRGTATPTSAVEAIGPILLDQHGMFQLVDLARLLAPQRRRVLQTDREEPQP